MSVTPSSSVVGVFTDQLMAEQAIGALHSAGFEHEQIWYSDPGGSGNFFEDLKSLFTGASTNRGNLASDLTGMGLSDEDIHYYSSEYSNGNIILAVQAPGREQETSMILRQYGADNTRGVSNPATNYAQQPSDSTQQENDGISQPQNNAQDWQAQPQYGTSAEHPFEDRRQDVVAPEHVIEDETTQPSPSGYDSGTYHPQENQVLTESEAETQPSQVNRDTPDYDAESMPAQLNVVAPEADLASQSSQASAAALEYDTEDRAAQPDTNAPEHDLEAQLPQEGTFTSQPIDEFQQLQEQLRATQQQLEEAKAELQAAKEREHQFQAAREREQQLRTAKLQLQDLQSELTATLAELRETRARLAQYE